MFSRTVSKVARRVEEHEAVREDDAESLRVAPPEVLLDGHLLVQDLQALIHPDSMPM